MTGIKFQKISKNWKTAKQRSEGRKDFKLYRKHHSIPINLKTKKNQFFSSFFIDATRSDRIFNV